MPANISVKPFASPTGTAQIARGPLPQSLDPMDIIGPGVDRETECEAILRTLPKWFGIEPALRMYARDSATMPTFALVDEDGRRLPHFARTLRECLGDPLRGHQS